MKDNVSQQNAVISQPFVNRKYKDSIFVDLLTSKEENIRQVCEALGESVRHENIEILRLDNTVYTGFLPDRQKANDAHRTSINTKSKHADEVLAVCRKALRKHCAKRR